MKLPITFAFDSQTWSTCITEEVTLCKVFRQADPGEYILLKCGTPNSLSVVFAAFLNQMRFGTISPKARALFASLEREVEYSDGGEPVHLYEASVSPRRSRLIASNSRYALRAQVEHANSARLSALQGDTETYQACDIPGVDITGKLIDSRRATEIADQTLAVRELTLKIGAQVMLIVVCRVCIRMASDTIN